MANLQGKQINNTYEGLLKTTDNAALSATSKALTDGAGNALTLSASTTGMEFTGNIDFTNATVTGIGGGGADKILSPPRQYKTTSNNKWNFAMPQDGNNYDGGGLQPLIDANPGRRFFTQVWTDTITECAVLVGDGFTGNLIAEIFDVWPDTGMPKSVVATTGNFTAGTTGSGYTWHTGSFASQQTLDYGEYYIALRTTTNKGPAQIYSAIGPGGYINRLVEFDTTQHPNSQNDAIDYIGGGMNSTSTPPYAEDSNDFSFRIDMFVTMLFKQ
jgi:hypothetical protein